jgi:hypothetical protein
MKKFIVIFISCFLLGCNNGPDNNGPDNKLGEWVPALDANTRYSGFWVNSNGTNDIVYRIWGDELIIYKIEHIIVEGNIKRLCVNCVAGYSIEENELRVYEGNGYYKWLRFTPRKTRIIETGRLLDLEEVRDGYFDNVYLDMLKGLQITKSGESNNYWRCVIRETDSNFVSFESTEAFNFEFNPIFEKDFLYEAFNGELSDEIFRSITDGFFDRELDGAFNTQGVWRIYVDTSSEVLKINFDWLRIGNSVDVDFRSLESGNSGADYFCVIFRVESSLVEYMLSGVIRNSEAVFTEFILE